jgi:small subunit ribosomal protein S9
MMADEGIPQEPQDATSPESLEESTDTLDQSTDALEKATDDPERSTDTLEESTDGLEQATAEVGEGSGGGEGAPAVAEQTEDVVAEQAEQAELKTEEPADEEQPTAQEGPAGAPEEEGEEEQVPRAKPAVPGAHLEVDIVPEGVDPLGRAETFEDPYAIEDDEVEGSEKGEEEEEQKALVEPIATAAIDLAAGARYRATGKRKTAIARVTLRPGSGSYLVNGRTLEEHFPRITLQRNIRQPLETVGYEERMDVVARLHGGGISAQAGALRHGVSRALLEADPNLRGELKRRGFLTRDSRAKERKKAGLKKARKRPQFSKR